ncbi:MAG: RNA methyltransferase [Flavipsychrobacter sp.]|nr:RNA methyltransferase [Flavipsychrobacter sp.]
MTLEREARINTVLNHRQPDLTILMENVHDPHNISAVMRTCDSIGVQEIYVLNTQIGLHETFGKKSSSGVAKWLTVHQFQDIKECMTAIKKKYKKVYATHLGVKSHSLYELDLTQSVALVFGNEKDGVSDESLSYCDGNFIIPQVGMVQSLNISVACAVTLYEAFRQRTAAGLYDGVSRMPVQEHDGLLEHWMQIGSTEWVRAQELKKYNK